MLIMADKSLIFTLAPLIDSKKGAVAICTYTFSFLSMPLPFLGKLPVSLH